MHLCVCVYTCMCYLGLKQIVIFTVQIFLLCTAVASYLSCCCDVYNILHFEVIFMSMPLKQFSKYLSNNI